MGCKMSDGENFVSLQGYIVYPSYKEVGDSNTSLLKGKLQIPIDGRSQQIKISAWGTIAEALNELPSKTLIRIHGHIEESSYDSPCKFCKGREKKYWTEVIVDNFIKVE